MNSWCHGSWHLSFVWEVILKSIFTLIVMTAFAVPCAASSSLSEEGTVVRTAKRSRGDISGGQENKELSKKKRSTNYEKSLTLFQSDDLSLRAVGQSKLMKIATNKHHLGQEKAIRSLFDLSRGDTDDYFQFRLIATSLVENTEQPVDVRKACLRLLTRSFVIEDRELGWSLYDTYFVNDLL